MALAASTLFEVQSGGSDTANGGAFDPGQTAGMNTDGAATSATGASPVFTSASYNFVAGDAGAKVFIAPGSNWLPGWYPIVSVSGGAATLGAAIGSAVQLYGATAAYGFGPSTTLGCATTGSPTGATWSIDYSQQASAAITYTDLASAGAGLTVSSAGNPIGKHQVGNAFVITGGTNFNVGRYVLASVAAGVGTVIGPGNITSGAGSGGTGGLGGALASIGQAGAHMVASTITHIKTGTYTVTSASTNVAGGCWSAPANSCSIIGYDTVRGDLAGPWSSGTRPTIIASGISTFTLITNSGSSNCTYRALILDGAALTGSAGAANTGAAMIWVHAQNMRAGGLSGNSSRFFWCSATGCSGGTAALNPNSYAFGCIAYDNTGEGIRGGLLVRCISSGNTTFGYQNGQAIDCVAYGNGTQGFSNMQTINCIAEANGAYGFHNITTSNTGLIVNCAAYNNTSGAYLLQSGSSAVISGFITGTASFFKNPGSGDFSLNNTAGGGASARAAGYPGLMPRGLTRGYVDIGAAQHQDVGGGSTGIKVVKSTRSRRR